MHEHVRSSHFSLFFRLNAVFFDLVNLLDWINYFKKPAIRTSQIIVLLAWFYNRKFMKCMATYSTVLVSGVM